MSGFDRKGGRWVGPTPARAEDGAPVVGWIDAIPRDRRPEVLAVKCEQWREASRRHLAILAVWAEAIDARNYDPALGEAAEAELNTIRRLDRRINELRRAIADDQAEG